MSPLRFIFVAVLLNATSTVFAQIIGSASDATTAPVPTGTTGGVTSTLGPIATIVSSTLSPVTTIVPSTPVPITSIPPTSTPVPSFKIHPNGNNGKCLDVRGAVLENGTPVQIFDCNGTPAQDWVIAPGEGHVVLANTGFCLDAGSAPANGVGMKIWQCFENLPAQDWFYTGDQRIALTGQGFCLDLTDGSLANSNQVQTWKCTDSDVNQIWTVTN